MWALSTVLLTLGKVPCTAWEKRVLLMKAQTSPALQGKGGRVSTQRAQSQYSLPGPSKSPSTDPRLQGPEYNSEPCFQTIQTSALRTAKGARQKGHGKLKYKRAWCTRISLQGSCWKGSAPCQGTAPWGQLPTAAASSPLSGPAGISSCEQWQLPGTAAKHRPFHPPSGPIRSLPASALTGGEQRPAGRRPRAPGAGSPSAGPASGTCGPRSSRSSGSSRSSIPPGAQG